MQIEAPEVMFSLVVPAFNEEDRVEEMLTEAVEVLRDLFPAPGLSHGTSQVESGIVFRATSQLSKGETPISQHHDSGSPQNTRRHNSDTPSQPSGFEIIIVDDGSTDSTISTVLSVLGRLSPPLPPSTVRIIPLASNRGKGGAVTHALRHVRGELCLFADADGATKFSDLRKLLAVVQSEGWTHNLPTNGHTETGMNGKVRSHSNASTSSSKPGIVIGSRAWMTHTPSVTARNPLRNLLMRAFHLLLRMLTPTRTSAIADTQCGFKLFTRASLPLILPRMRCEGWVFDVEMLMRAEKEGVPVREVSVGWREVGGSKLGLVGACWAMGSGVAVLRGWWALGEL